MYFNEINKIELLTPEEEKELFVRISNGDEQAREKVIISNLRLVPKIAAKYKGYGIDFEDLVQNGNIGLMTAVDKFDLSMGNKFSTYATYWIRALIIQYIGDNISQIRLPQQKKEMLRKVINATTQLSITLNREPTIAEIAAEIGATETSVKSVLNSNMKVSSYEANITEDEDGNFSLANVLSNDNDNPAISYQDEEESIAMQKVLNDLPYPQREVVKCRFGFYGNVMTLEEVGNKFSLTRERIRQIEAKALRNLRHPRVAKQLRSFVSE